MAAVTICSDFAVIIAMNLFYYSYGGFPHSSAGKESACNVGDLGSIPGLGRSPGEGKGFPLQYSGLENSMGCIVHGLTKSRTQLRLKILLSQRTNMEVMKSKRGSAKGGRMREVCREQVVFNSSFGAGVELQ